MSRITHRSINSKGVVQAIIRRKESVHWFLGLKQAEDEIDGREEALRENEFKAKKTLRSIRRLEAEVARGFSDDLDGQLRQEAVDDELIQKREGLLRLQALVRDAIMERDTAMAERDRILAAHPEALTLSYDELQDTFTHAALIAKEAHFVAGRVMAAQRGLPESVSEVLVGLLPDEKEMLLEQVTHLIGETRAPLAHQDAAVVLSHLSPEQRRQALITAAQIIQQSPPSQLVSHNGSQPH